MLSTRSRHPEKTRARNGDASLGTPIGWPDVLRAIQSDGARQHALALYRAAGFGPDDFARGRGARSAMTDALTRTEDYLEQRNAHAERAAIRAVRRRLEEELRDE